MTVTTRTPEDRARAFASQVRAQLSDLPPEEVDELTDGLHADVADRLRDGGELDDPERYADELRQAAGLPPRSDASTAPRVRRSASQRLADLAERIRSWWERTPPRRAVRDFALSLRPLWWVMRGFVVAWTLMWMFGGAHRVFDLTPLRILLLAAAVVVSVQWGRGRWAPNRWLVWLRRAVSIAAVIVLLPVTIVLGDRLSYGSGYQPEPWYPEGLSSNGEGVTNIFAYGCDGEPLDGVQLYRQDGRPLHTGTGDPSDDRYWTPTAGIDERGMHVEYRRNPLATMPDDWNVFPLNVLQNGDGSLDALRDSGEPADPPYERVTSLGDCAVEGGAASEAAGGTAAEAGSDAKDAGADASGDAKSDAAADARDAGSGASGSEGSGSEGSGAGAADPAVGR